MASMALMSPTIGRSMPSMSNGDGIASMQNLVNATAGDNSSMYQSCIRLKRRLNDVPGMEPYLMDMDDEEQESPDAPDIVTSLWNMLRRGHPLLVLYNALQPREPLTIPPNTSELKIPKAATFKFLHACIKDLGMPASDVFIITDLYGRDTTGFLKVIKVVDRIIQMLKDHDLLLNNSQYDDEDDASKAFVHNHEHVINEIITSERNYVSHLDTLQQFKTICSQNETIIPGDLVHEIFMNLNALVDYQRRFLIRLEQQNVLDPGLQNWGQLFRQYADGFRIYEPFVANTSRSTTRIQENWEKIKSLPNVPEHLQGLVSADNRALCGFMLKPLQRITKYPLFLDQLIKDKTYDQSKKPDLIDGKAAISQVLNICNSAAARASRLVEFHELIERVEDWKGHKVDKFGELIISGLHSVVKDDASKTSKERDEQYQIFLFEHILFCCKEANPTMMKSKVKLGGNKNNDTKPKKLKLQLKGRIFVQNVTNINKFQDNKTSPTRPYHLQIYWRGDPGIENFQICFPTAAQRDEWFDKTYEQVKKFGKVTGEAIHSAGTSQTDFIYLSNTNLKNPYELDDDRDDDDEEPVRFSNGSTLVSQDSLGSRHASNPSLRSRSTTGSSGPPMNASLIGRNVGPPRFPLGDAPPLKVSTSFTMATAVATPDSLYGQSYFSPTTGDSPSSMRSSQSGTMTPMGMSRQGYPSNIRSMENKHATAPPGTYQDRRSQRSGDQSQYNALVAAQSRSRSLSSPDVQNQSPGKRSLNGSTHDDVPVPPIPHHVLPIGRPHINRSQTNSPIEAVRLGRPSHATHSYSHDPYARTESRQGSGSVSSQQRLWSPATPINSDPGMPTQIKVRIAYANNYVTIVVPSNIKYQTLIDRIDAKMEKHSNCSITKGSAKLRWLDEGSYVSLKDEDDIQMVLDEWRDQQTENQEQGKPPPDLELEWHEGDDIRRKIHAQ